MTKAFSDMLNFREEYVAVLGGAGMLGASVVEGLSTFNARPIIVDIDYARGNALVDKIVQNGGNAEFFFADMSNPEEIINIIESLEKSYGAISRWLLSFYPRTKDWSNRLEDVPVDSWRINVDSHMNGVCLCASEVANRMANRGGGSIVNVGSIYGLVAPNFRNYEGTDMTSPAAYSAIKGGISSYSKYLASYYGTKGVRVNTIIPGGIKNNQPDSFVEQYNSRTCLGRLAMPEEIASAVIFLLSNGSSYITGIDLPVDGGFLAL